MDKSKARCSAFDKAVNLLAFKDRTVQEIKQKLVEKGYSSEEVEEAVEKLSYYGYLNDQNYTISYIKDNTSKKGKKLIMNELSHKGIDKNIVNDMYDSIDVDEERVIDEMMNRRFKEMDLSDEKSYRKVVGFFLRRGFGYDNIKKVIRRYSSFVDNEMY